MSECNTCSRSWAVESQAGDQCTTSPEVGEKLLEPEKGSNNGPRTEGSFDSEDVRESTTETNIQGVPSFGTRDDAIGSHERPSGDCRADAKGLDEHSAPQSESPEIPKKYLHEILPALEQILDRLDYMEQWFTYLDNDHGSEGSPEVDTAFQSSDMGDELPVQVDKGKAIDPREWGSAELTETDLNVKGQHMWFRELEKQKHLAKNSAKVHTPQSNAASAESDMNYFYAKYLEAKGLAEGATFMLNSRDKRIFDNSMAQGVNNYIMQGINTPLMVKRQSLKSSIQLNPNSLLGEQLVDSNSKISTEWLTKVDCNTHDLFGMHHRGHGCCESGCGLEKSNHNRYLFCKT